MVRLSVIMAAQPTSTIEPYCCLIPCQLSLCQAAVCTALALGGATVQEPNGAVRRTRNAAVMVASGRPVAIRLRTKAPHVHFGQRRRQAPGAKARRPQPRRRLAPVVVPCHGPRGSPGRPGGTPAASRGARTESSQPARHAWASVIGDVDVPACGRVSGPYRRERNARRHHRKK
jgi:hypothetical protein